ISHKVTYALDEAEHLIPSHTKDFAKNKDFPEGVQERQYDTDRQAQSEVITHAQNPDFDVLLSDSITASDGPTIVNEQNLLLGSLISILTKLKHH
ncbi:MAG: hypothetical protein IIB81_04375, partial [Nanoarchaeota archaeon]|nr:hypothetical protein [Nanoarchaeota archaeon]